MKKFLLTVVALVAVMSVNAQELGPITKALTNGIFTGDPTVPAKEGADPTLWPVAAGTQFGETESVVCKNLYDDNAKATGLSKNDLKINGVDFGSETGVQGNTNGPGNAASEGVYPDKGWIMTFDVKKDGYLYVINKATNNKNYVVWEQEQRIPYAMSMITESDDAKYIASFDLNTQDTLLVTEDGITTIIPGKAILMPKDYNEKIDVQKAGKYAGGTAVIKFPVYAGCKYDVHATGSKITYAGYIFSEKDDVVITSEGTTEDGVEYKYTFFEDLSGTPAPEYGVWTVAGGSNLMGSDWNTADTNNDMTSTDGVTYTLVKEGVVLEKGVTYEFKVAKDHAWTEAYPGNNATLTVEETATYTVTFTFNADSKEVSAATEKTGEAVVGEKTYSLIGTINGNWDNDTDMTWNEENQKYTAEFENVAAGKYEFKVRVNHDWAECYGTDGNNYVLELDNKATYVLITFNPETKGISTIIVDGGDEPAGNTVLWDTETAFDSWSATIVIEAEKFANVKAGDIIRVSYKDKGSDYNPIYKHVDDWSDWTDFQNAINKDNEGYFEAPVTEDAIAELQSKGLRFQGVGFTLTKVELISDASAINSVKKATKADGAIYNIAGQKVNASYKGLVIKNGKKYIQK